MSYANVAKVVGGVVAAGLIYAAGYVTSNVRGKKAREDLAKENERLRTKIRAYFTEVKAVSASMEAAMAEIAANPPSSIDELVAKLRQHGVPDVQIQRILAELDVQQSSSKAA